MSSEERERGDAARERALAAIATQPDDPSTPPLLRLCRALVGYLGAAGAAVTLLGGDGPYAVAAATDPVARAYVELQFTSGEGPCLEAHRDSRPVLVPDLGGVDRGRWPGYLSLAGDVGLRAVFSLPLVVGAVRLGVLDAFSEAPLPLDDEQVTTMLAFASIATEAVLDAGRSGGPGADDLVGGLDYRAEIYQAQGMLMVALGVDLAEALVRMRVHAFAHQQPLGDLAREIVAGRRFQDGEI